MPRFTIMLIVLFSVMWPHTGMSQTAEPTELPALTEISVTSTLDSTEQPALLWAPESAKTKATPLLVFLHSWSGDYKQDNRAWREQAVQRGWIYLHPNFRGRNDHPEACGSDWHAKMFWIVSISRSRTIKLTPRAYIWQAPPGGGHMAMLMAGYHPDRFSAVTAWVGISDLADWYRFHVKDGKPQNYARMVLASCGGPPGQSAAIDARIPGQVSAVITWTALASCHSTCVPASGTVIPVPFRFTTHSEGFQRCCQISRSRTDLVRTK